MAAAVLKGRAVPLLWASYTDGQLFRSQNSFEERRLRLLVSMLPEGVKIILLADRGLGRIELARTCQQLGIRFLIRIKRDVTVSHPSYRGKLCDYPIKKGMWRVLAGCQYRSDQAVTLNVGRRLGDQVDVPPESLLDQVARASLGPYQTGDDSAGMLIDPE